MESTRKNLYQKKDGGPKAGKLRQWLDWEQSKYLAEIHAMPLEERRRKAIAAHEFIRRCTLEQCDEWLDDEEKLNATLKLYNAL